MFKPTSPKERVSLTYALAAGLRVYNALGQAVCILLRQHREAGTHQIHWDGKDDRGQPLSSGTYLFTMRTGSARQATKMLLLR